MSKASEPYSNDPDHETGAVVLSVTVRWQHSLLKDFQSQRNNVDGFLFLAESLSTSVEVHRQY
jgi:hypothetical protein